MDDKLSTHVKKIGGIVVITGLTVGGLVLAAYLVNYAYSASQNKALAITSG